MNNVPKSKAQLADQLRLLQERLDWVPDWIWELDTEGVVRYSNPVVQGLLGKSPDDVVGQSIFDLVAEEDTEKCREIFRRAAALREPIRNIIGHFKTANSSLRTLEVSCVPMIDAEDRLIGYRGIARDISDQLAAERLAHEVEANFKALVERSRTGILIMQDAKVVYVNPMLYDMMGYTRDEVIGTSIWDYVHPEDVPRLQEAQRRRLAGEAVSMRQIGRAITKQGEIRYFDFHASIIQHKGAPAILLSAIDITDLIETQEALRKNKEEYRDLVEKISDWVWQVDENLLYNYVSPRVRDLLGYQPEEVLGRSPFDLMPAEYARQISEQVKPFVDNREPITFLENPMLHRDGHWVWVETNGDPIFDEEGVFRGYRGIDRDITERKRLEELARESEEQYKTLFDSSPLPMWVFGLESLNFLAVNEAMLEHYGYTREELIGKSMMMIRPEEEVPRLQEHIETKLRQGLDKGGIWVHKKKDGTLIDVEVTSHTIRWRGKPSVIILADDVTARRRAEAALRESREMSQLVMNNVPQFVFWKDTNSVYLGCNRSFADSVGLDDPDEIIGKTDYDLPGRKEEADALHEQDRRVIESGQSYLHLMEAHPQADGSTRWVDASRVPLHDSEGNVVGILGTYEDITERREAEQALEEAETKYRSLVEETMVGVYLIQDERFVYLNPRMLEIFGAQPEEMLGKSPLEFTSPEDRTLVVENNRKRLSGEVKSVRYSFRAVRVDGMPIDVEVHGAVTNYKGRPAIIGSLSDITERKRYMEAVRESEERYRQLFEHSPDMVFVLSAATNLFTAMNPAVTRMLGYEPYDVLGKTPADISPEFQPDGQRSREKMDDVQSRLRESGAIRFEWVHKRKDGTPVECEVSLVRYKLHGEDLVQAIVRDISERKHAEEARRRLERDLEAQKRSFYRETILSVTNGKLDICDSEDVEPFIVRAVGGIQVNDYSEVAPARQEVDAFVKAQGLVGDRAEEFMVGVGEAITNAVKHGELGRVYMGSDEDSVWIAISDRGKGIESLILPRAVLLRGFSTKPSLGLGYSIMLEVSDSILLNTGEQGTTVVLIKDKVEQDLSVLTEYLPDTWDNVPG